MINPWTTCLRLIPPVMSTGWHVSDEVRVAMGKEVQAREQRLKQQVQYPTQLFHTQFDDEYIYTHQLDPLTYFSQEDVFDDDNEVVGPVLGVGKTFTFSKVPYYWVAEPGQSGGSGCQGSAGAAL